MAGAIDIKSGSNSLSGANLFYADKNPLNQLFQGVDDVLGHQAHSAGQAFLDYVHQIVQELIKAIVGLPSEILQGVLSTIAPLLHDVSTYFGNVEAFLGGINPLSALFDATTEAENYFQNVLLATGAGADLVAAANLGQQIVNEVVNTINNLVPTTPPVTYALSDLQTALKNIPANFVKDVLGGSNLGADVQQIVTNINTALNYTDSITHAVLTDVGSLEKALQSIPNVNLQSILSGESLGNDVQAHANAFVNYISSESQATVTNIQTHWNSFVSNFLGFTQSSSGTPPPPPAQSVNYVAQTQQTFNTQQAQNKQIANNVDPTLDPVFHLSTIATTLSTNSVTQSASTIGFISIPDISATKDEIAWLGNFGSTGTVTGFYLTVYALNTKTGVMTWLYSSPNLMYYTSALFSGVAVSGSAVWNYFQFPNTTTVSSGITTVTGCALQNISLGNATGGTFTLTLGSATTSAIAYNAPASGTGSVQAALSALSSVGSGNVVVQGNAGGPYLVTFTNSLAGSAEPLLTVNAASLMGGAPQVTPFINVSQGQVYAVELAVTGSGSYNLVGQTSLIPQIGGSIYPKALGAARTSVSPTFDTSGAGSTLNVTTAVTSWSTSWSHTVGSSASSALVVYFARNGGTSNNHAGVNVYAVDSNTGLTYNLAFLISEAFNNSNANGVIEVFGTVGIPAGTYTLYMSASLSTSIYVAYVNSFSYLNVASMTSSGSYGASTSPSQTVTSAVGHLVSNCLAAQATGSTEALSAYSASSSHASQDILNSTLGFKFPLAIGDFAGAASVTFSATNSTSANWASAAVDLVGLVPAFTSFPTYSGVGSGYSHTTSASSVTGTWRHTANAGDCVIVAVSVMVYPNSASYTAYTRSVTYGGVAMTSLGATNYTSTTQGFTEYFYLNAVTGGSQTVSLTISGTTNITLVQANSVSYSNVGGVGAAQVLTGSTSGVFSNSYTVATTAALYVSIQSVINGSVTTATITNFSQAGSSTEPVANVVAVSRYNASVISGTTNSAAILIGDCTSASTALYTAAAVTPSTTQDATAVVIPLYPAISNLGGSVISSIASSATLGAYYSQTTPWFGLSGEANATSYPPLLTTFTANTLGFVPPTWANSIDIAVFGAGAGGYQGSNNGDYSGGGGGAGVCTTTTCTKAQFGGTWPSLTIKVGAGGSGAPYSTTNQGVPYTGTPPTGGGGSQVLNGATSLCAASGGTINATGQIAGYWSSQASGQSESNKSYNGTTYYGGAGGQSISASGSVPGGGGAGGGEGSGNGGSGGGGAVYILAYQ